MRCRSTSDALLAGTHGAVCSSLNPYWLCMQGKTHVLGLAGMGGIGKTTLAKALFDRIRAEFKQTCYIKDIRATIARKNGAESLQKAMMRDLADHDVRPRTEEEGGKCIKPFPAQRGKPPTGPLSWLSNLSFFTCCRAE